MKRLLVLVAVIALISPFGLFARDLSDEDSPTNDTTGGRFTSPFDDYLSVTGWSGLESNVLFLQFAGPEEDYDSGQFQAGSGFFIGDLYFGAYLGSAFPRTEADNVEEEDGDSQLLLNNSGEIVAIQEDTASSVDETKRQNTDFSLIAGLSFGDIDLGIKNDIGWYQDNEMGTIDPEGPVFNNFLAGTTPGDFFDKDLLDDIDFQNIVDGNPVDFTTGGRSTSLVTRDTDGNKTYENVREFDEEGFINDSDFWDTVSIGAGFPLAMFDATAVLDFTIWSADEAAEGSEESYETFFDPDLPEYEGVEGASSYMSESATESNSWLGLWPALDLGLTYPLADTVDVGFGTKYELQTYLADPHTFEHSTLRYSATVADLGADTVTTESELTVEEDWTFTQHSVEVPLSVTVTPSDMFQYSVAYTPVVTLQTVTQEVSGSWTQTETQEYADPAEPTVVETTSVDFETAEREVQRQHLEHKLDLGSQFYIAEKLRVNLGTNVSMYTLRQENETKDGADDASYTVTEQVGDNDARTVRDDFQPDLSDGAQDSDTVMNEVGDNAGVEYSLGVTYFFSENMELDLEYQSTRFGFDGQYYDTGAGDNVEYDAGSYDDTSIWSLGNWSLLMTIRY